MKARIDLDSIEIPFYVDVSVMLKNEDDIPAMKAIMEKMEHVAIESSVEKDENIDGQEIVHVYVTSHLYIWLPLTITEEKLEEEVKERVTEPLVQLEFCGVSEVWAETTSEVNPPYVTVRQISEAYREELREAKAKRDKARAERKKVKWRV